MKTGIRDGSNSRSPQQREEDGFAVSVDLSRWFSDERARCCVWAARGRRVRWLAARLRRRLRLRGAAALQGPLGLLHPADPLAVLRPGDTVRVIPTESDCFAESDQSDFSDEEDHSAVRKRHTATERVLKQGAYVGNPAESHMSGDECMSDSHVASYSRAEQGDTINEDQSAIDGYPLSDSQMDDLSNYVLNRQKEHHSAHKDKGDEVDNHVIKNHTVREDPADHLLVTKQRALLLLESLAAGAPPAAAATATEAVRLPDEAALLPDETALLPDEAAPLPDEAAPLVLRRRRRRRARRRGTRSPRTDQDQQEFRSLWMALPLSSDETPATGAASEGPESLNTEAEVSPEGAGTPTTAPETPATAARYPVTADTDTAVVDMLDTAPETRVTTAESRVAEPTAPAMSAEIAATGSEVPVTRAETPVTVVESYAMGAETPATAAQVPRARAAGAAPVMRNTQRNSTPRVVRALC